MDEDDPGELDPDVERRLRAPHRGDLPWIRSRMAREIAARRAAGGGCGDTLYALAFVLYQVGDAVDARLVFAAKHANFDCGCMIDRQLVTMGRTIGELSAALDPERDRELLELAADALAEPDHDDLVEDLRSYFGVS